MFGFIKNAFGNRPAAPSVSGGGAPVPAAPEPAAAPLKPRVVAVPPQPKPGEPVRTGAAVPRMRGRMERLLLNLKAITDGFPPELQGLIAQHPAEGVIVAIPVEGVMEQLAGGRVEVSIGELRRVSPIHIFAADTSRDAERVEIPLREILPKLDPSLLTRRSNRSLGLPDDIEGVFESKLKDSEFRQVSQTGVEELSATPVSEPLAPAPSIESPAPEDAVPEPTPAAKPPPLPLPPGFNQISAPDDIRALFERPSRPAEPEPAIEPVAEIAPASLPFGLKLKLESDPKAPEPVVPAAPAEAAGEPAPLSLRLESSTPTQPPEPEPTPEPAMPEPGAQGPAPESREEWQVNELDLTEEVLADEAASSKPVADADAAPREPEAERPPAARRSVSLPARLVIEIPPPGQACPAETESSEPVVPVAPATLPPTTSVAAPIIGIPLANVSAGWPEAIREETAGLPPDAVIEFPVAELGVALKRGLVSFPWRQIRSWLVPPIAVESMYDVAMLNVPVQVVAPLFMAAARPVRSGTRVQVDESIPAPFAAQPKEPVAPAAPFPASGSETVETQASTPGSSPPDSRIPAEMVARACGFHGIAGAIIASHDGLLVAAKLPPELKAETVAAFVPQVFSRLEQAVNPMEIGELQTVTFTAGDRPWQILKAGNLYIGAMGRPNEMLPIAQLKMLAVQLARQAKP